MKQNSSFQHNFFLYVLFSRLGLVVFKFLFLGLKYRIFWLYNFLTRRHQEIPKKFLFLMPVSDVNAAVPVAVNLLKQLGSDSRLVILQNGSNHKVRIFEQLKFLYPKLIVFRTSTPLGTIRSFNILLCFCYFSRADYFSFVSDHDELSPNWVHVLKKRLITDPNNRLIGVWARTEIEGANEVDDLSPQNYQKFRSLFSLSPNKKLTAERSSQRLINSYFDVSPMHNNFGRVFYGLFKLKKFFNLGLIPETYFGDRWFVLKLLAHGDIKRIDRCFRIDKKTNKNSSTEIIIEDQMEKISGASLQTLRIFRKNVLNVWLKTNHGRYLENTCKGIDLEILRCIHGLFISRKFKSYESNKNIDMPKDSKFTVDFKSSVNVFNSD